MAERQDLVAARPAKGQFAREQAADAIGELEDGDEGITGEVVVVRHGALHRMAQDRNALHRRVVRGHALGGNFAEQEIGAFKAAQPLALHIRRQQQGVEFLAPGVAEERSAFAAVHAHFGVRAQGRVHEGRGALGCPDNCEINACHVSLSKPVRRLSRAIAFWPAGDNATRRPAYGTSSPSNCQSSRVNPGSRKRSLLITTSRCGCWNGKS